MKDKTPEWFQIVEKAHAVATLFKGQNGVADAALDIAEGAIRRARIGLEINADVAEDTAEAAARLDALVAAGGITGAALDEQLTRLRASSQAIHANNERLKEQLGG